MALEKRAGGGHAPKENAGGGAECVPPILKGICPAFQVIRGFSQKIPADLLSYDKNPKLTDLPS